MKIYFILTLLMQAAVLLAVLRGNRRIIMNQQELAVALGELGTQLTKALDEIQRAIAAGGQTTPEVDAALANARAVSQALDDLNPDTP